jgi:hypothetical protein
VDPSRYSVTESLRDGRRVEIRAVQPDLELAGLVPGPLHVIDVHRIRGDTHGALPISRQVWCDST